MENFTNLFNSKRIIKHLNTFCFRGKINFTFPLQLFQCNVRTNASKLFYQKINFLCTNFPKIDNSNLPSLKWTL